MKSRINVLNSSSPAIPGRDLTQLVAIPPIERVPGKLPPAKSILKILAPVDLSADAQGPIEHAIDVARALGGDLTLVNVADPRTAQFAWPPCAFDKTLPGRIERLIVPGRDVPDTITAFADFVHPDLVLMTSKNYRRGFWTRSVTATVMGSANWPMLVTGLATTDSRFQCRRVLCVLTLDGTDEATVLQAETLARRSGGEMVLLGTVPEADEGLLHEVLSGANRPFSTNLALERLRGIGGSLSVPYKTSVMIGSPYRCIRLSAREYAPDIVVADRANLDMRAVSRCLSCPVLSVAGKRSAVHSISAMAVDSQPMLKRAVGF